MTQLRGLWATRELKVGGRRLCWAAFTMLHDPAKKIAARLPLVILIVLFGTVGRAEEKWTRVDTRFFSLCAETGNAREAKEWAVNFEQFRRGMEQVLQIPPTGLRPAQVIIFRNERAFDPYKPVRDGKRQNVNGYVMQLPTQTLLITNFDNDDSATRESIYWGGAQWFLNGYRSGLPDWFRAGLGELFKTFEVQGDEFKIGKARDNTVRALREDSLVPVEQLFGVRMNDLEYHEDVHTRRFFAESWLFVHYCVFGRERKEKTGHLKQLAEFLVALERGEPETSALRTAFGTDFAGMTRTLETYLNGGRYVIFGGKFGREAVAADFKIAAMNAVEIEVAKSYACLATQDFVGTRGHLGRAQLLDDKNAEVFTGLGDLAQVQGNANEAGDRYARAAELGSRAQRVWFYLAEDYVSTALRGSQGPAIFDAQRARVAANRFERAINCYPYYLPAFERLAQLMPSLQTYSPADRDFLELGLRMTPRNALVKAGLGVWELKNEKADAGRARLQAIAESESENSLAKGIASRALAQIALGGDEEEVRRLLAEGHAAEAGALAQKLIANPLAASRRAELLELRQQIGRIELLDKAELMLAAGENRKAAVLIRGVVEDELPAEVRQRADALLAKANAK